MKHLVIAVLGAGLCCWGIWQAARVGFARTLDEYAVKQRRDNATEAVLSLAAVSNAKGAVDRAVALLPADAESHAARAEVLQRIEDYEQARDEFERAVQLRPRDYYLWMLLGVTRDQNQDQAGALRALEQAVALAPSYAQPRWQLGNLLLRMGQLDRAFDELRQAAQSNPSLWPNVDDLAWGVYGRDANTVVRVIQPQTDSARMALALFFARHNQATAALEQFRAIRVKSDNGTEGLLDQLLKARAFGEAYEVWTVQARRSFDKRGSDTRRRFRRDTHHRRARIRLASHPERGERDDVYRRGSAPEWDQKSAAGLPRKFRSDISLSNPDHPGSAANALPSWSCRTLERFCLGGRSGNHIDRCI